MGSCTPGDDESSLILHEYWAPNIIRELISVLSAWRAVYLVATMNYFTSEGVDRFLLFPIFFSIGGVTLRVFELCSLKTGKLKQNVAI